MAINHERTNFQAFSVSPCSCGEIDFMRVAGLRRLGKCLPMKFNRFSQVSKKVVCAMPATIEMKFVPDSFDEQLLVHLNCPRREPILILIAAVDVDVLGPDLDLVLPRKFE